MRQTSDARLARVRAKAPSDLKGARRRALLRGRAALAALLRGAAPSAEPGRALSAALQLGDRAAAELADLPQTLQQSENDAAVLARDHAGTEEPFELRLLELVQQYRDGRELDPANAAPAELLAAALATAVGA